MTYLPWFIEEVGSAWTEQSGVPHFLAALPVVLVWKDSFHCVWTATKQTQCYQPPRDAHWRLHGHPFGVTLFPTPGFLTFDSKLLPQRLLHSWLTMLAVDFVP